MKKYTCSDYRQEMILAGLHRQLSDPGLSESEKERLKIRIRELEKEMGLE
jgi:hypothetical protein